MAEKNSGEWFLDFKLGHPKFPFPKYISNKNMNFLHCHYDTVGACSWNNNYKPFVFVETLNLLLLLSNAFTFFSLLLAVEAVYPGLCVYTPYHYNNNNNNNIHHLICIAKTALFYFAGNSLCVMVLSHGSIRLANKYGKNKRQNRRKKLN